MGKITEWIAYINAVKHPTAHDIKHNYNYFSIDIEAKKVRRDYRKALKLQDIDENLQENEK
jgi:hypothetical protein